MIKKLIGIGASSGIVTGTCKIILSETDYKKIKPNDILVTIITTPNMVPLMKTAKAIVTDEGGILSHPAIISREFGIPCVVGTKNATKILKDNKKIKIDGKNGIIEY